MLLALLAALAPWWSEARVGLNGTAYFEVDPKDPLNAVNRGNQQAFSYFNFGRGGNNPLTAADVGVVPGNGRLVPRFPLARQPDGSLIVARFIKEAESGRVLTVATTSAR